MLYHVGEIIEAIQENLQRVDTPEEYAELKVCELYEILNEEEVYAVLTINDKAVMEMLKPFAVMMEDYKTIIIQIIWNFHVQKQTELIPLPEVATKIWFPVCTEIQQVIEKCYDQSITLKEIDYYLGNISPQNVKEVICKLVKGYNLCFDKPMLDTWISQFIKSVNRYRDACTVQFATELIIFAKDALMLEGSFEQLEEFKSKVR